MQKLQSKRSHSRKKGGGGMPPNQVLYSTPNLWKKQSMNEKQVTHKNDSSSFFPLHKLVVAHEKIFSGEYSVFKLLDLSSWSGDGLVPDLPVLEETVDGWVDVAASGEQSWNKIIPLSTQSSKVITSKHRDQWLNPIAVASSLSRLARWNAHYLLSIF